MTPNGKFFQIKYHKWQGKILFAMGDDLIKKSVVRPGSKS